MKLYLSEYGKFKPRDRKGSEGVICTFTPFPVFDEEQEQRVTKGYFFTEVPETIERLDKHPDKGNGFIEWTVSKNLPRMIHGRLIAANINVLNQDKDRLARISEHTGQPTVVSGVRSAVTQTIEPKVEASPQDGIRYGEIKGKWLKKDGEFFKNTPEDIRNEFNQLKEKLGV